MQFLLLKCKILYTLYIFLICYLIITIDESVNIILNTILIARGIYWFMYRRNKQQIEFKKCWVFINLQCVSLNYFYEKTIWKIKAIFFSKKKKIHIPFCNIITKNWNRLYCIRNKIRNSITFLIIQCWREFEECIRQNVVEDIYVPCTFMPFYLLLWKGEI